MKLKYYLRGAGIGIIVSTFIFSIAFAFYKPILSDEEIMMEVSNRKLHTNRKKKSQKEKYKYGKSITHQGRIF